MIEVSQKENFIKSNMEELLNIFNLKYDHV